MTDIKTEFKNSFLTQIPALLGASPAVEVGEGRVTPSGTRPDRVGSGIGSARSRRSPGFGSGRVATGGVGYRVSILPCWTCRVSGRVGSAFLEALNVPQRAHNVTY